MPPKGSTQKSLSFKAQSKPKSSFAASAKDQLKSKTNLKSSTPSKPLTASLPRKTSPSSTTKATPQQDAEDAKRPDLDVDDPRWDGVWRKTKKIMNVPPSKAIHIDHENRIQQILRVFDLDPNFGPCMGMSRLERWQRAKDLELDPPQEIHDILITKQGATDHKENVFTSHGL
ncbi:DNA polymerase delta subunit 4 [Pseudozyma hubeiensis SY62]|uniref:DNA polymerase delta subunit 4 n=1 Tax=Pseudozyma hubeiensis (strain SY62) TaxID=1305764 RepID=R9NXP7_PSEHS|nr:DNA polymerase delta subunit 4 [Pseudozyma hubeiensis SY62]GAC93361.1 DNA polymerase delta subunit 4 [Pseudozyma hubeiensis SY62]